jgi:predicted HAD superfamily Cof-like phosphohydrolase
MSALDFLKSQHQQLVEKSKRYANQELLEEPGEPSIQTRVLQATLILEEALETIWEGLGVYVCLSVNKGTWTPLTGKHDNVEVNFAADRDFDLIKLIDGCCDLKVVTTGTLSACGVPDEPFQQEVDNNNLTKFPGGKPTLREDGKYMKPPGYKPPDFEGVLNSIRMHLKANAAQDDIKSAEEIKSIIRKNDKNLKEGEHRQIEIEQTELVTFNLNLNDDEDYNLMRELVKLTYHTTKYKKFSKQLSQRIISFDETRPPL